MWFILSFVILLQPWGMRGSRNIFSSVSTSPPLPQTPKKRKIKPVSQNVQYLEGRVSITYIHTMLMIYFMSMFEKSLLFLHNIKTRSSGYRFRAFIHCQSMLLFFLWFQLNKHIDRCSNSLSHLNHVNFRFTNHLLLFLKNNLLRY